VKGHSRMHSKLPFSKFLSDSLSRINDDIDGLTLKKIDETGTDKLAAAYIDNNALVSVPKLLWDKETSSKEIVSKTAVGYEHMRTPPKVQWDRYEVAVPFSGDRSILSTVSLGSHILPGIASIRGNTIIFTMESTAPLDPVEARAIYDSAKAMTQSFIESLDIEYERFRGRIKADIPARIESRKALLEKNQSDLEAFRAKP
jgi:hypothetical protein